MFGLNDNSQTTSDNGAADVPPAMPPDQMSAPADEVVAPNAPAAPKAQPPAAPAPPDLTPAPEPSAPPTPPAGSSDLLDLKQQALHSLQPLVNHLDQTPEEKFKTTMMLIQATDNSDLVKEAYAAANQITDEKARAQALLDVVNEINYFTQHSDNKTA